MKRKNQVYEAAVLDRGYLQENKGRLQTTKIINIIYVNTVFIWPVVLKKVSAFFAVEYVQWNTSHHAIFVQAHELMTEF